MLRGTPYKADRLARPALAPGACVHAPCPPVPQRGPAPRVRRQGAGHARQRWWHWRAGGEALAARRGTACFTPQRAEAPAEDGPTQLDAGWSGRAPRLPAPHVPGRRPRGVAWDAPWQSVTTSQTAAPRLRVRRLALGRPLRLAQPLASGSSRAGWASAPPLSPGLRPSPSESSPPWAWSRALHRGRGQRRVSHGGRLGTAVATVGAVCHSPAWKPSSPVLEQRWARRLARRL
jgi:hypothetical protein